MSLSWIAAEARTGAVLSDLRDLSVDRVASVIGAYSTATATLPVPTAPEGWLRATLPGGAFLVLVADVETDPRPLWGGLVTSRTRSHEDTLSMSVATPEAYLDRRFVGDRTFSATSQTEIVRLLVTETATDFPIVVEAAASSVLRDRTYADDDDKTLLSALSELSGVQGGPEWTVTWRWLHDPERVVPVLTVADRIGSAAPVGMAPAATFEMPGPVTAVEFVEDYSAGKGATSVVAVSTANADARPQSPAQVYADPERPPFEYRYTPSTSITDTATLTQHAAAALANLKSGTSSLSLSAVWDRAPALGADWWIGDDVGYRVGGVDSAGRDTVPAFPGGMSGTARAIGWEITLGDVPTISPVLVLGGQ